MDRKFVVGFTGTQEGMSLPQRERFTILLENVPTYEEVEFHHGDCIGADAEAHDIFRDLRPDVKIHVHPPVYDTKRAFKEGDVMYEPRPYLKRNQDIVDAADVLIATPNIQDVEELRSGTWSTIRRARKKGIAVLIVFPNGKVRHESKTL